MEHLVEVRAIVRRELLDRVLHDLKAAGVPRLTAKNSLREYHRCGWGRLTAEVGPLGQRTPLLIGIGASIPLTDHEVTGAVSVTVFWHF